MIKGYKGPFIFYRAGETKQGPPLKIQLKKTVSNDGPPKKYSENISEMGLI